VNNSTAQDAELADDAKKERGSPMKIKRLPTALPGAKLGVPRDRLLSCLRALHEADKTGAGLHLVQKLLFGLMQKDGRSVH
jgi:hypothetical protein